MKKGEYEFGLANYFLHELGNNLSDEFVAIKNENAAFDNKYTEEERIELEINRIKKISNKYDSFLDKKRENIKEIIVCIDLLLGIEIAFKTSFIMIADDILSGEEVMKIIDVEFNSYEDTIKVSDQVFFNTIYELLENICT